MPNGKIALILFADIPLPGQAGQKLSAFFNEHQRADLYTSYITDTTSHLKKENVEIWLTCNELFQENILLQEFPFVNGTKVVTGNMSEKMRELTHYFLTYQEYSYIIFAFHSFTFFETDLLRKIDQLFRLTKRGIIMLNDEASKHLAGLALSFPFESIYEDTVWERDQVQKDLKAHCQDYGIPCKSLTWPHLVLNNPLTEVEGLATQYSDGYTHFIKKLKFNVQKAPNQH